MRGIEQIPFFYDLMMAVAEATVAAAGFEIEAEGRRNFHNVRLFAARPR